MPDIIPAIHSQKSHVSTLTHVIENPVRPFHMAFVHTMYNDRQLPVHICLIIAILEDCCDFCDVGYVFFFCGYGTEIS